jgi:hypothetical protein
MGLLIGFLVDRGWTGSIMAKTNCGSFLPDICLISDCINGIYNGLVGYGVPPHVFVQSVIWVGVSFLALISAMWLLRTVRPLSRWDIFVSLGSCSFFFIGMIPDLLPGEWIIVHVGVATWGVGSGVIAILGLTSPLHICAASGYVFWYMAVSWWLVHNGTPWSRVLNWVGLIQGHLTLQLVILEWVGALGACSVCILYCLQETRRMPKCAKKTVHGVPAQALLQCEGSTC